MDGDVIEVDPEIGIASVEETMRPTDSEKQDDESAKKVLTKPYEGMSKHLRPLYISAHFDAKPLPRVLVDNGAAVSGTDSPTLGRIAIGTSEAECETPLRKLPALKRILFRFQRNPLRETPFLAELIS